MTHRAAVLAALLAALPAAAKGPPREHREETLARPLAWEGVTLPLGTKVRWARDEKPGAAWQLDDVVSLGADLNLGEASFAAGTPLQACCDWTYRGTLARDVTVDGWPLAGGSEAELHVAGGRVSVEKGVLGRDHDVPGARGSVRLPARTSFQLRDGLLAEADCPAACGLGALRVIGKVRIAPDGALRVFLAADAEIGGARCRASTTEELRINGAGKVLGCAGLAMTLGGVAFVEVELDDQAAFEKGKLAADATVHGFAFPAGTSVEGWPLAAAEFDLPEGRKLDVRGVVCSATIRFHRGGQLAGCWLDEEQRLGGLWVKAAELDPRGALTEATLSRAQVVGGVGFPAGTRLELARGGRLTAAHLASVTHALVAGRRCGRYATEPLDVHDTALRFGPDGRLRSCAAGDGEGFELDRAPEPDQYTIYDAVLGDFPAASKIADATVPSPCRPDVSADAETLAAFAAVQAAPFALAYNLGGGRQVKLVREDADLAFSAVGMNADRSQALVYVQPRAGGGRLLLLNRKNERWEVAATRACGPSRTRTRPGSGDRSRPPWPPATPPARRAPTPGPRA